MLTFSRLSVFLLVFILVHPLENIFGALGKESSSVRFSPYSHKDVILFDQALQGSLRLVKEKKESVLIEFLKENYLTHSELLLIEKPRENNFSEVRLFTVNFKEYPICNRELKVIGEGDLLPLILGRPFSLNQDFVVEGEFPSEAKGKFLMAWEVGELEEAFGEVSNLRKCYFYENGSLIPSIEFHRSLSGKPYKWTLSDKRVLKKEKLFFSFHSSEVDGEVQAYLRNEISSELKVFPLKFDGDGYLSNSVFTTHLDSGASSSLTRAYEEDHKFLYERGDEHFPEASVFAHASDMYDFFLKNGFVEWHPGRLHLNVFSIFDSDKNNAMYVPYDEDFGGEPSIYIGEGDGLVLENLLTDSDVVAHELSHHVIFDTLTTTEGTSLAIHEGLADYFTFAKSGSPCLGETICPSSSLSCYIYNQCLRTADNSLVYQDDMIVGFDWHTEGQIVSGTLWDLRNEIKAEIFDKVVLRSVSYFIRNMGYYGLILSLMRADEILNSGVYQCQIFDAFVKRGFSPLIGDLSCEDIAKWPEPKGISYDIDKYYPGGFGQGLQEEADCGALGGKFKDLGPKQTIIFFMLFFLSPILWILLSRFFFIRRERKKFLHEELTLENKKENKQKKRFLP